MSGTAHWSYPILPFGIVACTFFPTTFLEIAVYRSALTHTSVGNMTNHLLWNCFRDPWKLSRNNGSNSSEKFSACFKVWGNHLDNWAAFFHDGIWYKRTFLLPSTWLRPWWKMVQADKFVLHNTKNCYQSSCWFLKFSGMYIEIEIVMYPITS